MLYTLYSLFSEKPSFSFLYRRGIEWERATSGEYPLYANKGEKYGDSRVLVSLQRCVETTLRESNTHSYTTPGTSLAYETP